MALAALFAATLPVAAKTPSEQAGGLREALTKSNDPGLAVRVAQDGKILFEKGEPSASDARHRE